MNKQLFSLTLLMILGCGSGAAIAQPSPNPQVQIDNEESLDNAIEQFGYTSGLAFQCVSAREAEQIEQDALRAFTGITRLFGSDRAFFYAAAYGTGATARVNRSQCPQAVRRFRETMQNNALTGER